MWIDFHEIGHIDHPFRLDFEYFISRDTFRDEFIKSESMKISLLGLGLQLADVTDDEFMQAISFQGRYTELSLYDTFALSIAKARGWTLLTGDMPLRKQNLKIMQSFCSEFGLTPATRARIIANGGGKDDAASDDPMESLLKGGW